MKKEIEDILDCLGEVESGLVKADHYLREAKNKLLKIAENLESALEQFQSIVESLKVED